MNFSVFKVDLTTFNSEDDLYTMFSAITEKVKHIDEKSVRCLASTAWGAKNGEFFGAKVNVLWYDAFTFWAFAYETNKEQIFVKGFIDFIKEIPALKMDEPYSIEVPEDYGDDVEDVDDIEEKKTKCCSDLNLDKILEKIYAKGMYSLTEREQNFLKSQ